MELLREELEGYRDELKLVLSQLDIEERESLATHKDIVTMKKKANVVKEYGKKLRLREKKKMKELEEEGEFGFLSKKKKVKKLKRPPIERIVLQEDLEEIRHEIKDLEAERDHLTAINEIEQKKSNTILKDLDKDSRKLMYTIRENDIVKIALTFKIIRRNLLEIRELDRAYDKNMREQKKKKRKNKRLSYSEGMDEKDLEKLLNEPSKEIS